jgi:hypothetical protein
MALLNEANIAAARDSMGGLTFVLNGGPGQGGVIGLRTISGPSLSGTCFLTYRTTALDGSGGFYVWNPTDSSADNGSTIIKPNVGPATGRWNLLTFDNGSGGGGPISGTIAINQVAVGTGVNTIGGSSALTYSTAAGLVVNQGTITSAVPAQTITSTWNNAAVAFTGLLINVTNTASNGSSAVINVNVNAASIMSLSPFGSLAVAGAGAGLSLKDRTTSAGWVVYSQGNSFGIYNDTLGQNVVTLDANGCMLISTATVTANDPGLIVSQTWNNGAGVFTGVLVNVTNTASAAGSRVLDIEINSSSAFHVDIDGSVNANSLITCNNIEAFPSNGRVGVNIEYDGDQTGASSPMVQGAQTWNNGATVFTGVLFNVTNTASAANSRLLDLQVGGSSFFNVNPNGQLNTAGSAFIGGEVVAIAQDLVSYKDTTPSFAVAYGMYSFASSVITSVANFDFYNGSAWSNAAQYTASVFFFNVPIQMVDGANIILGTATGTAIATAANQKLSFWGAAPTTQATGYGTPTANTQTTNFPGTAATLAQVGGQMSQLLLDLKARGLIGA